MINLLKLYWLSIVKWGAIFLGIAFVILRIRNGGKQAERMKYYEQKIESQKEVIRQDRIVNTGNADGMRERLSDALRNKRDT